VTDPTHDPLSVLTGGDSAVDPDPAFTVRLRETLATLLTLPPGAPPPPSTALAPPTTLSDRSGGTIVTTPPSKTAAAIPYIAIGGGRARDAIGWYGRIFGATVNGEPYIEGDRIGHAELQIGPGVIYLADEAPELGVVGPGVGADVSLMLPVADADATLEQALAAGARTDRVPYDAYGQRNAWLVDPFGHRWGLNSPI
jgi:uncharacterized glyoxalase superfamily protein PhnB